MEEMLEAVFSMRSVPCSHRTRVARNNRGTVGSRKVAGSSPDEVDFFNLPNTSTRAMALRLTQPVTKMSTRNLPGGKGRPARKADNLTAICEPTA
jgi:hypothetical protein